MSNVWMRSLCGAFVFSLFLCGARAEDAGALKQQVEGLEQRVKELSDLVERQQRLLESAGLVERQPDFPKSRRPGDEEKIEETPALGGVYSKPFLMQAGRKTFIGGYVDLEFRNEEGKDSTFDQHRLIPFIYSDITDQLKFATEIEFEHGGDVPGDGEIKIEFATLDYLFTDWFNFRGGIILSPLGKVNLVHDSPLQDLTDRPLIDSVIFPTTLSEAGVGFHGELYPTDLTKLNYEIYVVNGFNGGSSQDPADMESNINTGNGIRSARGSKKTDNNNNKAVVGRVAFSPMLGMEFGGSFHLGAYDDESDHLLAVYGFDTTLQRGPFELLGEVGFADIELSDAVKAANAAGTVDVPEDLFGFYVQGNYHFMPAAFQSAAPFIFRKDSTFTAVLRYGHVDLDGAQGERDRFTIGLNFRPIEGTVFKLDYQFNDGDRQGNKADAFLASFATYF